MAGKTDRDGELLSDINVTPFVDIVLVLLIILMVTSTAIVKASLPVELPKAASGGAAVETTLNLVVDKEGKIALDGQPATEPEIIARIKQEKAKNPKLQAVISADKGVAYGNVIHLIDLVKTNGVSSFALNVERVPAEGSR